MKLEVEKGKEDSESERPMREGHKDLEFMNH